MQEKLDKLELEARLLEVSEQECDRLLKQAGAYTRRFVAGLESAPTYVAGACNPDDWSAEFPENPSGFGELLDFVSSNVDVLGINPAGGGHLGYIPGGGIFPSALGDFLADVGNRYSGVEFASPGAVQMERSLVRWMTRLVGCPDSAGGDLTSGGSMANLTGLVTAREAKEIASRDIHKSSIYLTAQAHHCIDKALRVAGMAECPRRIVPMDDRFRMQPEALSRMVRHDRVDGLAPWLVVASAGTTDTGAVDPVPDIAAVAHEDRLCLLLDASFCVFFLLCDEGLSVLKGLDQADSFVMDPHKWLF